MNLQSFGNVGASPINCPLTLVKFAPVKSAPVKFTPVKFTPVKFTPVKSFHYEEL